MLRTVTIPALLAVMTFSIGQTLSAQHSAMPAGMTHEQHLKLLEKETALKKRGADAMGFDQEATTHHFMLARDGGAIEVTSKNERDDSSRPAIRSHLKDIAQQFARGVFDKPFATHAEIPPGVATMQRLRTSITYSYEDTVQGGRVQIRTTDSEALDAIHDFLRYQIKEHGTGDRLTVPR